MAISKLQRRLVFSLLSEITMIFFMVNIEILVDWEKVSIEKEKSHRNVCIMHTHIYEDSFTLHAID